ncbi:MAG: ComF family protein [Candidatus Omnitrophica bacterium]|nr:ComF family protein [Candidatus Omnitrophota bacterium]
MFINILQGALNLIFPDNCLLCRQFLNSQHKRQVCSKCLDSLAFNPTPLTAPDRHKYAFDEPWSVCFYNETAQKLLHAFKYQGKTSLRKTFVPLMINFIDRHHLTINKYDIIAPIPLHPSRLRERGYNQSLLLSLPLSQHYGIPHTENLLIRQKRTQTQTELGAKQRWTNLEDAFRIKNLDLAKDKNILLIDDLYTTGATANTASIVLKKAGALGVGILTLSKTV